MPWEYTMRSKEEKPSIVKEVLTQNNDIYCLYVSNYNFQENISFSELNNTYDY